MRLGNKLGMWARRMEMLVSTLAMLVSRQVMSLRTWAMMENMRVT